MLPGGGEQGDQHDDHCGGAAGSGHPRPAHGDRSGAGLGRRRLGGGAHPRPPGRPRLRLAEPGRAAAACRRQRGAAARSTNPCTARSGWSPPPGPAGHEWVQRAVAVREVSRRKGFLLDPADDNVLSFLTLPQLRELVVQHWPCFEPYFDDRRDLELALDELEVARHVVSRNRALSRTVLDQAERACARLLELLGAGTGPHGRAAAAGRRHRGTGRRPLLRRHRRLPRPGAAAAAAARRGPVRRRPAAGRGRHRPQPAGAELLRAAAGPAGRGRLPGAAAVPQPGQQRGPPPGARTRASGAAR